MTSCLYYLQPYFATLGVFLSHNRPRLLLPSVPDGIFIDENLRWQTHIDKLSKKITSGLGVRLGARDFVPTPTLHCMYNAVIQSQIDYCNLVWGKSGKTLLTGGFRTALLVF